jgi:hypothetical protein
VTEDCVTVGTSRGAVLLLWPRDRASWDPSSRTITFRNVDGALVTAGTGMHVVVGGGGGGADEAGADPVAWVARMRWVVEPSRNCPLDAWWAVGDLRT